MPPTNAEFSLQDLPGFGLAMVLIILFMYGYSYLSRRDDRRRKAHPQQAGPTVPASAPVALPPANALVPVATWVPLLFDLAAHILILGGSGSGKTRTARGLVRFIVEQRRERVILLDPKANRDTWMGLPVLVRPAAIDDAMQALLEEFQRRLELNPSFTEAEAEQTFERIWIVVDEVSFVRDNCRVWPSFLRRISSMARSLKLHLIVVNQSERVEELGLRGRGDLLANFAKIGLSQAVWQDAPAQVEIGSFRLSGDWRSHFPEAYHGRLPALISTIRCSIRSYSSNSACSTGFRVACALRASKVRRRACTSVGGVNAAICSGEGLPARKSRIWRYVAAGKAGCFKLSTSHSGSRSRNCAICSATSSGTSSVIVAIAIPRTYRVGAIAAVIVPFGSRHDPMSIADDHLRSTGATLLRFRGSALSRSIVHRGRTPTYANCAQVVAYRLPALFTAHIRVGARVEARVGARVG
ncbi:MAG: DUF87 domain-containing protein [Blastochloris sp.]|nr:DUF87 domain-containing protein [Blastochloris sp.]